MSEFITSRVVLYKNGIGSFERKGTVDKDTTIELFFPADAMNDILKSINVTSADNQKHSITYEVPPVATTSHALPPIATHKDLYTRLVRETVIIRTTDGRTVEGMVLAVDHPHDSANAKAKVSVFTKENLMITVEVDSISSMEIPGNLVSQSKSLKINIVTKQKQNIKVTYIRSCPVWKPTYRAVLGDSATDYKLFGWATIHNPGPDDWQGTSISLVAGQPVSFINEVYKPKYRKRPKLQSANTNSSLGISGLLVSTLLNDNESSSGSESRDKHRLKERRRNRESDLSRSDTSRSRSRSPTPKSRAPAPVVAASTTDSDTVDLFRYDLSSPVNLAHGQSALVPIFESAVQGRKVALYNPTLHKSHPFSSLVMSNTTGLSLEAGSVTVFDGDMYIGEAHLIATKPNERRFLPFALEFGVLIQSQPETAVLQPMHHVLVQNCNITFSRKSVRVYHYVITNKSEKLTELLLEHPKDSYRASGTASLIVEECYHGTDKSKQKIDVKTEYVTGNNNSGNYGLNFTVPPRSTTHLVLHSQSVEKSHHLLRDYDLSKRVIEDGPLATALNSALTPYWKLANQVVDIEHKIKIEKDHLNDLEHSQSRARSNLNAIRENDKQRRYTEQLDKLEDEINQANKKLKELNTLLHSTKDRVKITGDTIYFDSNLSSNLASPMQI